MNECKLCRKEVAVLSDEHVPPKSTGNRGVVHVEYLTRDQHLQVRHADRADGVALRVLCTACNNRFGSRLGTTFSAFAAQVRASGRFHTPSGGRVFVSAPEVYPSRVVRQLYLSYLCVQPVDDQGRLDPIREFIKSRDEKVPTGAPRIALYFNPSDTYRIVPICGLGSLGSGGRNWTGGELAAPGLGVIFSLDGHEEIGWLIDNKQPTDVTSWGDCSFDHSSSMVLRLPRLRVEHPHPLGFGTHREVERWQSRRKIIWLVTGSEDPAAINGVAAVWRTRRPKR